MKILSINKTALVTLLFTLVCVSSVYAWDLEGRPRCKRAMDEGSEGIVGLTSEQKDQLATLFQKFIDDTAETRIELNTARANLEIILATSEPDKKAIKTLIQKITDLEAKLMEKEINHQLEVKKVAPGLTHGKMFRCCQQDGCQGRMRDANRPSFPPGGCPR